MDRHLVRRWLQGFDYARLNYQVFWQNRGMVCEAEVLHGARYTMNSLYRSASSIRRNLFEGLSMLKDLRLEQGAVHCDEDNSAAHRLITADYVVRGARLIIARYHMVQELHRLGIIDMRHFYTNEHKTYITTKARLSTRSSARLT